MLGGEIVLRGIGSGPYHLSGELDKNGTLDDAKMSGTVTFSLKGDFDVEDAVGIFSGQFCSGTWEVARVGGVLPTPEPEIADVAEPLEAKLVKLKKIVEQGLISEEEAALKSARLLEDF